MFVDVSKLEKILKEDYKSWGDRSYGGRHVSCEWYRMDY